MQSSNRPPKFLVPFAQNDSARVEIPATTADATRFSQSLGSPPLTGMPPEAGGVPPQLEDFNGAMNQIARGVWWALGGGRFAYDADWANNGLIGGYARGAVVPAALGPNNAGMGDWYNNTEGNTADPDTVGTGWVPGYNYGTTALVNQTGGTITLTPAQAAKRKITITGTLTSNLVIVVPNWIYDWNFYNATSGAFTVTVKNAATPGALVPQNAQVTPLHSDSANVTAFSPNIAPANAATQAAQFSQTTGRLLNVQIFAANATYTPTAGAVTYEAEVIGGGGGGGGTPSITTNQVSAGAGGGAGGYAYARGSVADAAGSAIVVGAGGAGGPGATGSAGGTSSFRGLAATGGQGGTGGTANPSGTAGPTGLGAGGLGTGGAINAAGGFGMYALYGPFPLGGSGGASRLGSGAIATSASNNGAAAASPGAGGSGSCTVGPAASATGGAGAAGRVVIREYS